MNITIRPLGGIPRVQPGDDLSDLIGQQLTAENYEPRSGDLFCVAQKIVSKSEDQYVELDGVKPGERARSFARDHERDPRVIQLILDYATEILVMERGIVIARTPHGFLCANAGIDTSNLPGRDRALLLPEAPDRSARHIREELPGDPAVLITDTWGRPWREGQVNFAIGLSGLAPIRDYRGEPDDRGKKLSRSRIAVADELASAAELVSGKNRGWPVVLIRGVQEYTGKGSGEQLLRDREMDFFQP